MGIAFAGCNLVDSSNFQLRHQHNEDYKARLENVPRKFPIDDLDKMCELPNVADTEGQVIGIVTPHKKIETIDSAVIKKIVKPLLAEHIKKTMSAYDSFEIKDSRLLLSKDGHMLLGIDFSMQGKVHTGYLAVALKNKIIVIPPRQQVRRCVRERNSVCEDPDECIPVSVSTCTCLHPRRDVSEGCVWVW